MFQKSEKVNRKERVGRVFISEEKSAWLILMEWILVYKQNSLLDRRIDGLDLPSSISLGRWDI